MFGFAPPIQLVDYVGPATAVALVSGLSIASLSFPVFV
jgi:hypothetical protein